MIDFSPLALKRTVGTNFTVDSDDVVVTKRSLDRLGHFKVPDSGLSPYPNSKMIEGVESFQRSQILKVDGIMKPDGPTATLIGQLLSPNSPPVNLPSRETLTASNSPTDAQCDHLYWNVDIPTCRAIMARRGKRAAARCFHTATIRYAACLRGTPIDQLPPLDVWNQ